MKVRVIADDKGAIVGLLPLQTSKPEGDVAPSGIKVVPISEQSVHEIEVPDEMATPPLFDLPQRYRVEKGKLIEIKGGRNRKAR